MEDCGIYQIRNIVNNKRYIGQSTQLRRRKIRHFSDLRSKLHDNKYLMNSFHKYGENNFVFEIIELCDEDVLDEREVFHWNQFNWDTELYNIATHPAKPPICFGEDHHNYGKILSEETRRKMSKSRTGKLNPMYGRSGNLCPKAIGVQQVDLETGEILGEFESMRIAGEKVGIHYTGISKVCLGKGKSAGGYGWQHAK